MKICDGSGVTVFVGDGVLEGVMLDVGGIVSVGMILVGVIWFGVAGEYNWQDGMTAQTDRQAAKMISLR